MPKTNKQRERAKRRRKGELQSGRVRTNIARMQVTHFRQSRDADNARMFEEAVNRKRKRK